MRVMMDGPGRRLAPRAQEALLEFTSPSGALAALPMAALTRGTIWLVAGLFAAMLAAMAMIPVEKVVTGRGTVVATEGTLVVQPLDKSILRAIHVQPGQRVRKGDLLAELDPTDAGSQLVEREARVATLTAQLERLQAEILDTPYRPVAADPARLQQAALAEVQVAQWQSTLARYDSEILALRAQVQRSALDVLQAVQRLQIATEVEDKRAELQRLQVGSQLNRLAASDARLQAQQALDDAKRAVAVGQQDLQAKQNARESYNQGWHARVGTELNSVQSRLTDANELLARAKLRHDLVQLRADRDAIVLSVARGSAGSVLQGGAELITLVPSDSPLAVDVALSGRDIGWVRLGEPVVLKFDTLPFARYGTAAGTVRVVSPTSFTERSDPGAASLPRPGGSEPYYRARISLDRVAVHDVPEGFRLMPGLPVTADVEVGRRTVLEYLLMRVLTPIEDGMREP